MATHELTRRALYDLVWAKPMRDVAADLGISDVGLKKVCDRHRVPTPPQGHWNKKAAGKPTKQTLFTKARDPQDDRVVINGGLDHLPESVRAVIKAERERRAAKPRVVAPPSPSIEPVTEPHKAIAVTARVLRRGKPNQKGLIEAIGEGLCGVAVGPGNIERAISIIHALATGLQERELSLRPDQSAMSIASGPDEVKFTLTETVKRYKHEATPDELAFEERRRNRHRHDRSDWWVGYQRSYPEFDFILTGEFVFAIEGYIRGVRLNWKDGKRQRVEQMIDEIVSGLIAALASKRASREEREQSAREWKLHEERQQRRQARLDREKRRLEFIGRFVDLKAESERLCAFLTEMDERCPADPDPEFSRLIEWARQRVSAITQRLDPSGIAADLRSLSLFPAVDPYAEPDPA